MSVEAGRLELSEDVDFVDVAVDAVRDRDIDEAVFASEWYGGFGAIGGERQEPRAATSAEDQGNYVFHGVVSLSFLTLDDKIY
jgi:hypothetical protein